MYYQPVIFETTKNALVPEDFTVLGIEGLEPQNILKIQLESKKSIGVKEIREVIVWNSRKDEKRRVVIVENAEKLTVQAQNALLKVLEEPNPNFQIILVVDNIYNLLITVRSRCRKVSDSSNRDFRMQEEVKNFLENKIIDREEILENIISENSDLDSRVVINQFLEEIIYYISENNLESLPQNKLSNMIELIEKLIEANKQNINIKIIKI